MKNFNTFLTWPTRGGLTFTLISILLVVVAVFLCYYSFLNLSFLILQILCFFFVFRWEDLLKYLFPLKEINNYQKIEYEIRKQQYLEALTWQSVQNPFVGIVPWRPIRNEFTNIEQEDMKIDMELVIQSLKMLEPLCSQKVSLFFSHCSCSCSNSLLLLLIV